MQKDPLSWNPSPGSAPGPGRASEIHLFNGCKPIEIVACGALAGHIREIASRRGWRVAVHRLPAAVHDRQRPATAQAERAIETARASGAKVILAYADCGAGGGLDDLAARAGVSRLPSLHCSDLYAGGAQIARLFTEEPGTYLLTDYLIRSFDTAVIGPLGLDRHPERWADHFGRYTRLVWVAQSATAELEEAANKIANRFNLPLTRMEAGTRKLEEALAQLIEPAA